MSTTVTPTLLRRFALRHWKLAPKQSALLVGILALGVAVFVSIRLANRAAVSSFANFTDTLTGQSDWIVQAPAGTLPEAVLPELRAALGTRPVHIIPVVEAAAARPPKPGETNRFGRTTYTLLGVDLVALSNLVRQQETGRAYFGQAAESRGGAAAAPGGGENRGDFWTSFRAGPQVWLSDAFAKPAPAEVELILDERVLTLPVAGVIPHVPDTPQVPADLMILDLPKLQELTGKQGRLDRVEFLVEPGPRADERREELRTVLEEKSGDRWGVTSPGARRESAETMTRAFRLNLNVLSLIALLVGLYLIFQAMDGAVVRRRAEIAILRSLGVEEGTIHRVWLAESAVLGLLGGALGVLLGWAGAQASVRAIGQTVNALYFATTVRAAMPSTFEILLGLALGVGTGLVAGWWPAREAARTPPAQVLHRGAAPAPGSRLWRNVALGLLFLAGGVACVQLPPLRFAGGGRFPLAGYAAAFLWIFGGGITCAFLLPLLARALRAWGRRRAHARVALSHLQRPSGRHRIAVAALHCAIGMTAGMGILVASFEQTVRDWLQRTLHADLYIASNGAQAATSRNRISPAAADRLAQHPAVAAASRLVTYPIEIDRISTLLSGTDLTLLRARSNLPWVQPPRDENAFDTATNETLALVSEAFSERFGKNRGDVVRLPTPSGPRELTIAAVFADYGNERGSILVDRTHTRRWFQEDAVTNVSLWVKPGVNPDALRADLLREFSGLSVFTNARLRTEILRIFRQTFAITYALEIIGVGVAVIGLALTLTSVLLDRRDELTTLRALGFARGEIALSAAIEGGAVAVSAVAGGLVLSLALGWLLIHVINKQSFGWTLGFALPWAQLAGLAVIVSVVGVAVSYAVGLWGADLPADREE
ncbi:MAG TPA: FtsX-like permease family protein [Opitutaceae bacterium]